MDYNLLREIADSWVLLALFLFFIGAVAFAWRPGSRDLHDDAASVPFRNEEEPDGCRQDCGNCRCGNSINFGPEGQK